MRVGRALLRGQNERPLLGMRRCLTFAAPCLPALPHSPDRPELQAGSWGPCKPLANPPSRRCKPTAVEPPIHCAYLLYILLRLF